MSYRRSRFLGNPVAARRRVLMMQWAVALGALLLTGYLVMRALLMA